MNLIDIILQTLDKIAWAGYCNLDKIQGGWNC